MKKMISILLIIAMCLCSTSLLAKPAGPDLLFDSKYTHEFYSKMLNDDIYPQIRKFLTENNYMGQSLDQEKAQTIVNGVQALLIEYFMKNETPVLIKPVIQINGFRNGPLTSYVLEMILVVYDAEESHPNMIIVLHYVKKFILHMEDIRNHKAEI